MYLSKYSKLVKSFSAFCLFVINKYEFKTCTNESACMHAHIHFLPESCSEAWQGDPSECHCPWTDSQKKRIDSWQLGWQMETSVLEQIYSRLVNINTLLVFFLSSQWFYIGSKTMRGKQREHHYPEPKNMGKQMTLSSKRERGRMRRCRRGGWKKKSGSREFAWRVWSLLMCRCHLCSEVEIIRN